MCVSFLSLQSENLLVPPLDKTEGLYNEAGFVVKGKFVVFGTTTLVHFLQGYMAIVTYANVKHI